MKLEYDLTRIELINKSKNFEDFILASNIEIMEIWNIKKVSDYDVSISLKTPIFV